MLALFRVFLLSFMLKANVPVIGRVQSKEFPRNSRTVDVDVQVRDGLDLPFEGSEDFDSINWVVWKQQLTRLHEVGAEGPEMRASSNLLTHTAVRQERKAQFHHMLD